MININIAVIKLGNLNLEVLNLYNFSEKKWITMFIHQHSFYEMHFVLEGSTKISIKNEIYTLNKNDVLFLPKNCAHYCLECSPDFKTCCFNFDLKYDGRSPAKKVFEYGYFCKIYENAGVNVFKISSYERSLLENIFKNVSDFSIYGVHKINTEATNLFLELSKKLDGAVYESDYGRRFFTANEQISLRRYRVECFIANNQSKNCSIESLAKFLHLSVRQTTRFITKAFNKTYKELLTQTRMTTAQNMINENRHTLSYIAKSVGYKSYNGFLTAYKNYFGKTPQENGTLEISEN